MKPKNRCATFGFTLVESVVTIAVFVLAGGIIVEAIRNGALLSAKNNAINIAHDQARHAADRLVRDIHAAVSIPVLVDTTSAAVNGAGPAAGVAFLMQAGPICSVASNAAANQSTIQLSGLGSYVPQVGQRVIVPTHQIEADITGVNGNTLTLATNLGVPIVVSNSGTNYNVIAYVADVVRYIVVNGELRFFKNISSSSYNVVARDLTNPTPFGAPYSPSQ